MTIRSIVRFLLGVPGPLPVARWRAAAASSPPARVAPFELAGWVQGQKSKYGTRVGVAEALERRAEAFDGELMGLRGPILHELVGKRPRMVPHQAWGSDAGWCSRKRFDRWKDLLQRNGVATLPSDAGILIRFVVDASEWVPHPYAPPHWAMINFQLFSSYIVRSEDAFALSRSWERENSLTLTQRLENRLRPFPVRIGAGYRCSDHVDYADVALVRCGSPDDTLQLAPVWKGEAALARLVSSIFPDACREYAPSWLEGQRLDIYVPSLKLGFEYQGQEHYQEVPYFGGRKGLKKTQERDRRKLAACRAAGVMLVEWRFSDLISEATLRAKLHACGLEVPHHSR